MLNNQHSIRYANGNFYLDNVLYETYFPGIDSVIMLNKSPEILIMPVQQAGAGGLLMKIRNAKGDRVVNVTEFLENQNITLQPDTEIPVIWSSNDSALKISLD